MKKVITKDCPSCSLCHIEDDYSLTCSWGKSKKKKYMKNPVWKMKKCKLKK